MIYYRIIWYPPLDQEACKSIVCIMAKSLWLQWIPPSPPPLRSLGGVWTPWGMPHARCRQVIAGALNPDPLEFWSAEMSTFQMTTLGRTSGWWDGCGHCYLIHSTPSYRQSAAQPHQPLVKWTSALIDLLDSARLGAPNSAIFLLWHVEAQSISSSPKPYSYAMLRL